MKYLRAGAIVVPPPVIDSGGRGRCSGGWRDRIGGEGIDRRPPTRLLQRRRLLVRIASEHGQVVLTSAEILDRQMRVVRDGIAAGAAAGVAGARFAILPVGRDAGRAG